MEPPLTAAPLPVPPVAPTLGAIWKPRSDLSLNEAPQLAAPPAPPKKEPLLVNPDRRNCAYSVKPCAQRRMDGYAHCVKHILEDPTAPFAQCEHFAKNTNKRCSLPVPLKEPEPRCAAKVHRLLLTYLDIAGRISLRLVLRLSLTKNLLQREIDRR